jgi:hypothetical protein
MKRPCSFLCLALLGPLLAGAGEPQSHESIRGDEPRPLYPEYTSERPAIPSPFRAPDGREYVIGTRTDGMYTIFLVTVENGGKLRYGENLWFEKGRQLEVDAADFPTLAQAGLHSGEELARTETITGRPVGEITRIGRPEQSSGVGFMAADEDIISVLAGDDRLVRKLDLTHPQLARPLFHVFNVIQTVMSHNEYRKRGDVQSIWYNDRVVELKFWGAKGWQESIFDDEILGYWEIEIRREPEEDELAFVSRAYSGLSEKSRADLTRRLSFIHTGEMAAFYAMRYGFYEGHTGYRADPIAIAAIFGLRTLEEIHEAFDGDVYSALTDHHTPGALAGLTSRHEE